MRRELAIEGPVGDLRVAVFEDGELVEFRSERLDDAEIRGTIYLGRVRRKLPGLGAAFVDIGEGADGFLSDSRAGDSGELPETGFAAARSGANSDPLRPRGEIVVQAAREPREGKGAKLTADCQLPGSLAVLLPTRAIFGISKRIEDEAERLRLMEIAMGAVPPAMGAIVRTEAMGAEREAIAEEIAELAERWYAILNKAKYAVAPVALHREERAVPRLLRALADECLTAILVEDPEAFAFVRDSVSRFAPERAGLVKRAGGEVPIFAARGVASELDRARSRIVRLKCGGTLAFDPTEALTAIDVNSGSYRGGGTFEDAANAISLEAAREIARQIRLRNIGGIVVTDFLRAEGREGRERLRIAFEAALSADRVKIRHAGFTASGLFEFVRKREGAPLKAVCDLIGRKGIP